MLTTIFIQVRGGLVAACDDILAICRDHFIERPVMFTPLMLTTWVVTPFYSRVVKKVWVHPSNSLVYHFLFSTMFLISL